ncbi:MAG: hypothetical protein OEQ53_18845 [Saprospiraceae bacterium]|nr:hypothetical protein [Saprospiraceae bacterium]
MKERGYNEIRRKARLFREEPSARVWSRLERRLNQDKGKISISTLAGALAMAASFIIIVSWLITLSAENTLEMQELDVSPYTTQTVYQQVDLVHAAYASESWKSIEEGTDQFELTSGRIMISPAQSPTIADSAIN